jgi:hypothetical protein
LMFVFAGIKKMIKNVSILLLIKKIKMKIIV